MKFIFDETKPTQCTDLFLRYLYYSITLSILHVSVCKGPSWGNHTKVIQNKTSNFCTQLTWCKWVKRYLLNYGTVLTSIKFVACLQDTGMYCIDSCTDCSAFQFYVYFVHLHIGNAFCVYVLIVLMFFTTHFQYVKMASHLYNYSAKKCLCVNY